MKKIIALTVALLLSVAAYHVQAQNTAEKFFDRMNLMLLGSYYYPEQWPAEQWERDIRKMSEMGFDFTHFGEFAWASMEPEEGRYDFSWLDRSVELAAHYGLKVVMCTPTPTPPVWLTQKHPEVLIVNDRGQTVQHGTRQHASWSSDKYLEYVEKIVSEMALRYGSHPAVIGWQIDNEPSHYGKYDYSDNAQQKFRVWLKEKYKTIDALNDTWGAAFWSETYRTFDQIRIPNPNELPVKANPHSILDFKRFSADEVARFVNFQTDVLHRHIASGQWVTTNTMPYHTPVDPTRMDALDFHTYTKYLITGHDTGYGDQGFRIGSIPQLGFNNDTYRNYAGGVFGVMELQPGQVNWGSYNPQPMPGAIRMWLYHVFAGGGKFVCNYRFRQPLKGSEQYHYGMIMTDGVTPSPGAQEYMQVVDERELLKKNLDKKAVMPKRLSEMRTAMMFDFNNEWEIDFQPQTVQWHKQWHRLRYYNPLKSFGAPVDIIDESHDFTQYPFLIATAYELLDEDLVARWKAYAQQGGHLVLTCRTGQKNREAALWETPLSQPIHDLIGAEGLFFDHLPQDRWAHVEMDGQRYGWNTWGDVVAPSEGTEVWGSYADQFYKGKAAVLHRKLGKGSVTYIGVDTDDGRLEKAVLHKLYAQTGKEVMALPEGVTIEWRDGFWVALNYSSEKQTIELPSKARILIGTSELDPCGVTVWKEK